MEGYRGHPGINKLGNVMCSRIRREKESPLVLDFGMMQENGSLITDTFPVPIPKGDYMVCRHLTLGPAGSELTSTETSGQHEGHTGGTGEHTHAIPVPEKMRSISPGDRVLVAWVQNEAVVIDIILKS